MFDETVGVGDGDVSVAVGDDEAVVTVWADCVDRNCSRCVWSQVIAARL